MLHPFDEFRLLDSVQAIILHVHGVKITVSFSSDLEHTAEFPTSEVFVEHIKVPLELPWTFIARYDRLGIPETGALF